MSGKPKAAGFVRGDFDPAFPLDDKVQLLRASLEPLRYHAAMSVYWHVVAAAWRRPERIPADRTCPEAPEQIADLVRVGLLDRAGRLPIPAFNGWIGRAIASRTASTDRKRRQRSASPERMSRGTDVGQTVTARGTREGVSDALSQSYTTKDYEATEGGPGETRDAAVALQERTGSFPSEGVLGWLNDMAEAHTEERLLAAIDRTPMTGRNVRDYLISVRDALRAEDHRADKAEREAEKSRVTELRKPTVLRQRPPDVSDEEADRLARAYRGTA